MWRDVEVVVVGDVVCVLFARVFEFVWDKRGALAISQSMMIAGMLDSFRETASGQTLSAQDIRGGRALFPQLQCCCCL